MSEPDVELKHPEISSRGHEEDDEARQRKRKDRDSHDGLEETRNSTETSENADRYHDAKRSKLNEDDTPSSNRHDNDAHRDSERDRFSERDLEREAAKYEPNYTARDRDRRYRDDDRYDSRDRGGYRRDDRYRDDSRRRNRDDSRHHGSRRHSDHQSQFHHSGKDRFGRDAPSQPENQGEIERPVLHDIEEKTVRYPLKLSRKTIEDNEWWTLDHKDLQMEPVVYLADANNSTGEQQKHPGQRMLDAPFADPELLHALWEQKNRMDDLFDRGKGGQYYYHRDSKFEQDRRGSSRFLNRAGDKLWEVHEAFEPPLFDGMDEPRETAAFADVCGGPGAFSDMLLERCRMPYGYGITLLVPITPKSDIWYKQLMDPRGLGRRFTIHEGVPGGKGDVYLPENLEAMCKTILEDDKRQITVVVADGGFKINKFLGQHMENFQETFSHRIILSEFLYMMRLLVKGGRFVCKMFDSFSALTVSLMYLAGLVFEEVYIVKPLRSRIVNSERYFVGYKFRGRDDPLVIKLTEILVNMHKKLVEVHALEENSQPSSVPLSPISVVPLDIIMKDEEFMKTMKESNNALAEKQTLALKRIMDAVDDDEKKHRVRRQER